MNTRVAATGLLCLLTACSVPSRTDNRPIAERNADTLAVHDSAVRPSAGKRGVATPSPRQYSPSEMFMQAHGDFMMKREPWRPDVRASFLYMHDTETKGEPGDFDLRYLRGDLERKLYLDPNLFLNAGLQFSNRNYEFSSGALGAHDETLYRASASLGMGYFLDGEGGSSLLEFEFNPGLWTDFSGTLHHGDWQFYASSLWTYRYSNDIFLKLGAEYAGLFRDVDVFPLLGVTWLVDPQWRVDVLLPRQVRLTYDLDESNSFDLSLDLDGGEYRIRAPKTAVVNPGIRREVSVQELQFSAGAQHRFDKSLSGYARVGLTMAGDYNFRSNSATAVYDGTLEPQMFFQVGIGWTF